MIVIAMARSSYISSRLNLLYVQRCKAEYLLKSALNIARTLIVLDKSTFDPPKSGWGLFIKGTEVPANILGVDDPNTTIALEINAESAKLPIRQLANASAASASTAITGGLFITWRDSFARLFKNLGFDDDQEEDQTGLFPGQIFKSQALVSNLIDYMDSDSDSYRALNFTEGIENQIPVGRFPNKYIESLDELASIPGFTPKRVHKLINYVSIYPDQVNVNLATPEVLKALDEDLTDDAAISIRKMIEENGGFDQASGTSELPNLMPNFSSLNGIIVYRSQRLVIRAKVQFGDRRFFLDSIIVRDSSGSNALLPRVESMELYG